MSINELEIIELNRTMFGSSVCGYHRDSSVNKDEGAW